MCGRYTLSVSPETLQTSVNIDVSLNLQPRYNIAPTQMAPVVRHCNGKRKMEMLRWGLIPPWSKDQSASIKLINARGETISQKPSFREAYKRRRCLIPADGFYEWRREGDVKQPYRIGFAGGPPFLFAGLWDIWTAPENNEDAGSVIETFTIVTTTANRKIAPIHHRMPVIVDPKNYELWLTGRPEKAAKLIFVVPEDDLVFYRVSMRVNKVSNDDEGCVKPLKRLF